MRADEFREMIHQAPIYEIAAYAPPMLIPEVTMEDVERFMQTLQRFGITCAEAAEGLRMLPDGPEIIDDQPEWYDNGPNPWDAHTVTFDDTMERIDHALMLHQGRGTDERAWCWYE